MNILANTEIVSFFLLQCFIFFLIHCIKLFYKYAETTALNGFNNIGAIDFCTQFQELMNVLFPLKETRDDSSSICCDSEPL